MAYDEDSEPVHIPVNGILDLHTLKPGDVPSLVPEYIAECRRSGILQVRIIHGKGRGVLRDMVHAQLGRMAEVVSYRLDDGTAGGWGATIVQLKQ